MIMIAVIIAIAAAWCFQNIPPDRERWPHDCNCESEDVPFYKAAAKALDIKIKIGPWKKFIAASGYGGMRGIYVARSDWDRRHELARKKSDIEFAARDDRLV